MDLSKVRRLYSGAIWRSPEAVRLRATRTFGDRSTRQVPGSSLLAHPSPRKGEGVGEESLGVVGKVAFFGAGGPVPFCFPVQVVAGERAFQ